MDTERLIVEEIAFREHRHEYEAALVSHHLAVQVWVDGGASAVWIGGGK